MKQSILTTPWKHKRLKTIKVIGSLMHQAALYMYLKLYPLV